ncbi:MAG: HAMP domain-containing histidine kinase [Chloroflexi bacterium]|nr:HAMP domain-containing histidine kinase [Chloroflexota bacterium]
MRGSPLWLKLALAFAGTAVAGILIAALLIERATSAGFGRYLEHVSQMGGMMEGMMGGGPAAMMGQPEAAFLDSVRTSLWISGGVAVVVAALLAALLTRHITAPLRRLSSAAARVARGDTSCRVESSSSDEMGTLTNSFNCMVESLDRNQQARRKLMSDLAHEMSTPLAVMQGTLEGMIDGVVETTPASIASLREEALLLSRLVKDLRTLAQAESGKLNLASAPADLGNVVASTVNATGPVAKRRGVSLSLSVAPGLPKAMIDTDRVSQVMANLLSNAERYTSEGGVVAVRVGLGQGNGNTARELVVSVSDTGPGISEHDLPHIFDRYYQGQQPRDKRSGGSGIGLAVVKELVEAHGGRVWVESAEGEGSTFFFTVPAAAP